MKRSFKNRDTLLDKLIVVCAIDDYQVTNNGQMLVIIKNNKALTRIHTDDLDSFETDLIIAHGVYQKVVIAKQRHRQKALRRKRSKVK